MNRALHAKTNVSDHSEIRDILSHPKEHLANRFEHLANRAEHLVNGTEHLENTVLHTKMSRGDLTDISDILSYPQKSFLEFDDRVKFLYPRVDTEIDPLPRNMSITDKSRMAKVQSNNPLRVEYAWEVISRFIS